ncbi:hypothetical protein HanXRQr2_Chr02g0052031 [Helianthus annuus]|nr:hypothetical protein HanXRQr2_Chr02g0052031 [Helianthus annuus]KAJ0776314.1 hypothetical protein HanLR1_Chr02g0044201 [Helianthus annuus]
MCPNIQLRDANILTLMETRRTMELNKKDANNLALVQRCKHFDICIRRMCWNFRVTFRKIIICQFVKQTERSGKHVHEVRF